MEDAEAPEPSETPNVLPEPPKEVKKHRRRSSIGSDILSAFKSEATQETMSPIEVRPPRPKRVIPTKVVPPPPAVTQRKKEPRYSFDLGECVETKSCLKPTNAQILVRKGLTPAQKSITQRTAAKIVNKYSTKTPNAKKEGQLKFNNICSIRIITPRPDYNPENLEMPHSDDEEDQKKINPNRERLSTVALRLTPDSQSRLVAMQEEEVFQFNAEMVFGDRDEPDDLNTAIEPVPTTSEVPKEVEEVVKKKTSRRKSLIVGAASPMKSPAKIEKPRFEDEIDEISEPKRRNRRSVRLQASSASSESSSSSELLEAEPFQSKKREFLQQEPSTSSEPQPKRTRGKVQVPTEKVVEKDRRRKSTVIKREDVVKNSEEKAKPLTTLQAFFAPKPSVTTKKAEEVVKPEIAPIEKKINRRRSTRFEIPPKNDELEILDVLPTTVEVEVLSSQKTLEVTSSTSEVVPETSKSPGEPKVNQKLASIFMPRSPKPINSLIEDVKKSEALPEKTSSTPTPSVQKTFSIFSPRPKPKETETPRKPVEPQVVDLTDNSPVVVTSSSQPTGIQKSSKRSENQKTNGDQPYLYFTNIQVESKIFEETTENEDVFKPRPFDIEVLKPSESVGFEFRSDSEEVKNPLTSCGSNFTPEGVEKLPGLDGTCPLSIIPSCMENLNEGAMYEEEVRGWLRKWKRRVRKDAEREIKKEKKGKKSRKRGSDDEDSSEDYELEESRNELENPLVLIGPPGVGKTALIRVLAKQENMKIISMGPECDRTGSEIKKKLQEAMRSHRVDQSAHRRMTFFVSAKDKNGMDNYKSREKSPSILDKNYTQSLIVFEHVDVFFDTLDRHGVTALLEVVNEAAVPVVFTSDTVDWPRSSGQIQLDRTPFEIQMERRGEKTWKYVQKLIYSCRGVFIDESIMSELSLSVNHDLQALIQQAHFFSLSPSQPLPLTTRTSISSGFSIDWELETTRKPTKCHKNSERFREVLEMYSEFFPDGEIDGLVRTSSEGDDESEVLSKAVTALRGRYTRRQMSEDVLPLLVPINRVEEVKKRKSRRHLHRFEQLSEGHPMDGNALKEVVDVWASMES